MNLRPPSLVIVACLVALRALSAAAEEQPTTESTSFESRILAITDTVLANHIDPPTRQQMILNGVKSLYRASHQAPPTDLSSLSERVSELASAADMTEYLGRIRVEFRELDEIESILTNGMLMALPGGSFLIDAKTNDVQEQVLNNRYVGTGIALAMNREEELPQITKAFAHGPARKAGAKSLDLILEIDGESTTSKDLKHVVGKLRGEAGSQVTVVVRQPDSPESRRLTVTLGRVFIPSVEGVREGDDGEWQYTLDSAEDIALLRFKSIGPSTLHELRKISANLLGGEENAEEKEKERERERGERIGGVVLDLREGGGILHDIVMVVDGLLDGGTIGHIRSRDSTITHEARPGELFFQDLPIVILVSRHTSAGSVLFAAALQDNERAIIVGEPTAGETYVNSIIPVPDRQDKLQLATAVMLRGDGTPLLPVRFAQSASREFRISEAAKEETKRLGFIMPDHVVHASVDGNSASDPILNKAVEILRTAKRQAASSSRNDEVSG